MSTVEPFLPPIFNEFQPTTQQVSPPLLSAVPRGNIPLYSELPSIARALGEKQQFMSELPIDPKVAEALLELDRQRALRGQRPLSMPKIEQGQLVPGETLEVLQAMPSPEFPLGRTMQPVQEKTSILDIPGNVLSNASTLFRSIPKIPAMLVQTARDIPQAPGMLSQALAEGDFQKAAQVPGLNLVPGVYTLGNLLEGDVNEIIENPLFTALDVAPFAGAKVFRAPASMLDDAGRLVRPPSMYRELFPKSFKLGEDIGLSKQVQALEAEPLVSAWDLAKNKVRGGRGGEIGRMLDEQRVKLRGTRAGGRFQASFGTQTRDLMTIISEYQRYGLDLMDPNSAAWRLTEEMNRITGGVFEMDKRWIDRLRQHIDTFGDDFGVQNYGAAETWARRRTELSKIIQEDPRQITNLPDFEQRYISDFRETVNEITRPYTSTGLDDARKPLIEVPISRKNADGSTFTTNEIYDYKQGARILKAREKLMSRTEFTRIRDAINDPRIMTQDELIGMIENSDILNMGRASRDLRTRAIEGYAHLLRANGYDAIQILRDVRAYRANKLPIDSITALDSVIQSTPVSGPLMVLDDLVDVVWNRTPSGRRRPRSQFSSVRDMVSALRTNDIAFIRDEFNRLRDLALRDPRAVTGPDALPESFLNVDRDIVMRSLDAISDRQKWLNSKAVRKITTIDGQVIDDKVLARLGKTVTALENKSVPARFIPVVERSFKERLNEIAEQLTETSRLDPEAALEVAERVRMGDYEAIQRAIDEGGYVENMSFTTYKDLLRSVRREQVGMWKELAADGLDPVWVHHVPIGKTSYVHARGVNVSGKSPAWFNERGVDFSPSEGDMALALQSQAMEVIQKKVEDLVNETIVSGNQSLGWNPIAKNLDQITSEMRPLIDAEIARTGDSFQVARERLLKRTFVKWNAPEYRNFETNMYERGASGMPGRTTSDFRTGDLYVPKNVFDALEKLQEGPKAIAVWDPVMNVFRTSTLLLSPRWQLYNVLGNALTITMAEGLRWVENLPDAYRAAQAVRRGEAVPQIGLRTPTGERVLTEAPAQIRTSLGQATKEQTYFLETGRSGAGGRGAAEAAIGPENLGKIDNWAKPLKSGLDWLTDMSVRLNAMVDDTTRIAGYMSAYNRHLGRPDSAGVTRVLMDNNVVQDWTETSRILAERDMRKFAYNWDSMTPFERTVARRVFPFYGFFSHMLRYAYQYAMDHPLRVAVTAAFARAELEDWGTGMPSYLHNLLLIGAMDEKGNQKALNFKGWNPFADLSTLLTPVGWLSQANPIISTLAEQFGIDPRTGEAALYPTATYNEQTGRLELKKRNVVQSFVENVIPQSQVFFNLSGANPDFNQLARSNPEAAGRLTASALGFPVMLRDVNVPQEIAKAELARRSAARAAANEAIRTGTTEPVRAYPQLSRQVEQLRQQVAANPQAYGQYQIPVPPAGVIDLLQNAGRTVAGVGS